MKNERLYKLNKVISIDNRINKILKKFYKGINKIHFLQMKTVFLVLLFLPLVYSTKAQSNIASPGLGSGQVAGAYQISDSESVNYFSGRLSFRLPVANIIGRGDSGLPLYLNLVQDPWQGTQVWNDPPAYNPDRIDRFGGLERHYASKMEFTIPEMYAQQSNYESDGYWDAGCPHPVNDYALTRVYYVTPEGEHIEFRDDATQGQMKEPTSCNGFNRGTNFTSVDGSGAKFVSVNNITDINGTSDGSSYFYKISGYLYLNNGSTFRFENGKALWMRDRNGNLTDFTQGITDSLGRKMETTSTYQAPGPNEFAVQPYIDTFTSKGIGGVNRSINVHYVRLGDALQTGFVLRSFCGLFGNTASGGECSNDPSRYNPLVVSRVVYPDGREYKFKYNSFGDVSRIELPTGAAIEYTHDWALNGYPFDVNGAAFGGGFFWRRITERKLYSDGNTLEQKMVISRFPDIFRNSPGTDESNQTTTVEIFNANSERLSKQKHHYYGNSIFHADASSNAPLSIFYDSWKNGKEYETDTFASDGTTLLQRQLNSWENKPIPWLSNQANAPEYDTRLTKQIAITLENGNALAVLKKTEYDDYGNSDPNYFSYLNVKRSKAYNYKVLDLDTAQNGDIETIAGLFSETDLASVSETDYLYDAGYKERHLLGLPTENRVMNPTNPTEVLAKSHFIYDEQSQYYSMTDYGSSVGYEAPTGNYAHLRGNITTLRTWNKDTDTWSEIHNQFDNFGNKRKVWNSSDDISRFLETEYSSQYYYAYPTKVITPAPGDGTHGTDQESSVTTVYDFYTGLPLTITNEFGQTTATEYNDPQFRPTRVYAVNFSAPESRTEYNDTPGNHFIKTKRQIDVNIWDETTTFTNNLGRTIKTQAKDSQGDIFTETEYDGLGRVKRTTNPYREGDTKLWSKPRYDELSRVVETYSPAIDGQTGVSLGITSYSISTVPNFIGMAVTTTDASGRKSRSITNALGQLMRIDEAIAAGGTETADLGSLEYPNQPTYYTYSPQGNMVKVQQGKTGDATIQYRYFKYDSLGRLIRVNQPEQEVNTNLDLADAYNTSGHWTAAFTYDLVGNVKRATDANGTNIISEYDKANRVTKKCYTVQNTVTSALTCAEAANLDANTPAIEYFYDGKGLDQQQSPNYAKGKLTKVTSSVSETRYTQFDYLGRLMQMEQRTPVTGETLANATPRVSSYQYNFAGALTQETYPSGRVIKNEYKSDGDLMRISGQANGNAIERTYASGFSYTPDGKIQRLKLGNGRWESAKFNERLQVTELALGASNGDGGLWKLTYKYGELQSNGVDVDETKNTGNIAQQTVSFNGLANPLVQTYQYDALYRLTEARETNGSGTNAAQTWKQNFSYDRFGNRLNYNKFVGATQVTLLPKENPTIDQNKNRLSLSTLEYDKNGNLTTDADGRVFVFDGENKQRLISANGSNVGKYFYDGEGQRVKKIVYESDGLTVKEETIFVYSSGKLVAEYTNKQPAPNAPPPTTSYTAVDQIGSPRVITDSNGQIISRHDFMPFGEEAISNTGERPASLKYNAPDSVRQRFTGYQKDDETGLDFAEARMYENRHGRFTAVDPLLASGNSANPQTFNRYVYCQNRPLVFNDPTGLFGDYYNNQGEYIGTDGKNDGKRYYADFVRRDKKNRDIIWVTNVRPITFRPNRRTSNFFGGDNGYDPPPVRRGQDYAQFLESNSMEFVDPLEQLKDTLGEDAIEEMREEYIRSHNFAFRGLEEAEFERFDNFDRMMGGEGLPCFLPESNTPSMRPTNPTGPMGPEITNEGPPLGNFGVPRYYTYNSRQGNSVYIAPNAMKHLEETQTHGGGFPGFLRLNGQVFQNSLHSSIEEVLSRGPIRFEEMYRTGETEIMFGRPRNSLELPAVKHFRQR